MLILFTGCAQMRIDQLQSQIANKQTDYRRVQAEVNRIESLMKARAMRSPLSAIAGTLVEQAAKDDFKSDSSQFQAVLGAGICLFNSEECSSLFADLKELSATRSRFADEARIIADEINAMKAELNSLKQ